MKANFNVLRCVCVRGRLRGRQTMVLWISVLLCLYDIADFMRTTLTSVQFRSLPQSWKKFWLENVDLFLKVTLTSYRGKYSTTTTKKKAKDYTGILRTIHIEVHVNKLLKLIIQCMEFNSLWYEYAWMLKHIFHLKRIHWWIYQLILTFETFLQFY